MCSGTDCGRGRAKGRRRRKKKRRRMRSGCVDLQRGGSGAVMVVGCVKGVTKKWRKVEDNEIMSLVVGKNGEDA